MLNPFCYFNFTFPAQQWDGSHFPEVEANRIVGLFQIAGRQVKLDLREVDLEQFDGRAWAPVGRFGSVRDANVALDQAAAGGVHPDHLRVTEVGPSRGYRLVVLAGYAVIAALLAWWIYIFFIGS